MANPGVRSIMTSCRLYLRPPSALEITGKTCPFPHAHTKVVHPVVLSLQVPELWNVSYNSKPVRHRILHCRYLLAMTLPIHCDAQAWKTIVMIKTRILHWVLDDWRACEGSVITTL